MEAFVQVSPSSRGGFFVFADDLDALVARVGVALAVRGDWFEDQCGDLQQESVLANGVVVRGSFSAKEGHSFSCRFSSSQSLLAGLAED